MAEMNQDVVVRVLLQIMIWFENVSYYICSRLLILSVHVEGVVFMNMCLVYAAPALCGAHS